MRVNLKRDQFYQQNAYTLLAKNNNSSEKKSHLWSLDLTSWMLCTEMRFFLCTWFGEFCSCCSLTALPGPAWVLLNWICKELISSLYMQYLNATVSRRIYTVLQVKLSFQNSNYQSDLAKKGFVRCQTLPWQCEMSIAMHRCFSQFHYNPQAQGENQRLLEMFMSQQLVQFMFENPSGLSIVICYFDMTTNYAFIHVRTLTFSCTKGGLPPIRSFSMFC